MKTDYLRVSVTNKCNLRCIYCYPSGNFNLTDHRESLQFEEIVRIVGLFVRNGVSKIRLTGGEPLLRDDIVELVNALSSISGIEDLSITTNGVFLEPLTSKLKTAGLHRINISIDTMNRETYRRMTGFDLMPKVLSGISSAIEVGFNPVKINCVIVKGLNDSPDQIREVAQMSFSLPVAVRFVEYYPTNKNTKPGDDYVPNSEVKKIIEHEFGTLESVLLTKGYGPAKYFKIPNSPGRVGFISGRSSMFCRQCNRLRLTFDGKVRPCLYSPIQYDLKELLRNNAGDEEILRQLQKIQSRKGSYTKLNSSSQEFSMQSIGG